jgi:hypothetical protein
MITGALRFWHTAPPVTRSHASRGIQDRARILDALPAGVTPDRRGCNYCQHLAACRVDGPLCEATLIAEVNGRVVRL